MLGFISFLHNLFSVVWIGGLIMIALTLLPSAREVFGHGPQTKKLMSAILRRQRVWIYISIAGLFITGIIQARAQPDFTGLMHFNTPYASLTSIKHLLTIVMVAIALYRSLVLTKKTETATPQQSKLSMQLILVNASLGVVILLLSGFMSAL
jgi:putative copper export protein